MDINERCRERAEKISMEVYRREFYRLSNMQQEEVWKQAEEDVQRKWYQRIAGWLRGGIQ